MFPKSANSFPHAQREFPWFTTTERLLSIHTLSFFDLKVHLGSRMCIRD
jgi:hypothetical protein